MNDYEILRRYFARRAITWACHHDIMLIDPSNRPDRCPLCGCGHPRQAIVYEERPTTPWSASERLRQIAEEREEGEGDAPSLPPAPVKGPSNPAIKDTSEGGAQEGSGDSP